MNIRLVGKFAEKNLDRFFDGIYHNIKDVPNDSYYFDFTAIEWISNEELLVLSALFRYFSIQHVDFKVEFKKPGVGLLSMPESTAKVLVEIWEVWKIGQVLEDNDKDYKKYFGIVSKDVEDLKKHYNYYPREKEKEIYNRHNITPFISLNKIEKYHDRTVEKVLNVVYQLNRATNDLIVRYDCEHPFITKILSHIISKELYENFLDHYTPQLFPSGKNEFAFMSLALRPVQNEIKFGKVKAQEMQKLNFETEAIPESRSFFYDEKAGAFKNESIIELSFLDFGEGITQSLLPAYLKEYPLESAETVRDSEVLKYAFRHNSSRFKITNRKKETDRLIPRGLFDVLCMVKRYGGMLVARSNKGKILYDFSNKKDFDGAYSTFGNESEIFPGTLISIYIPPSKYKSGFDHSVIKPNLFPVKLETTKTIFINIYQIINSIKSNKKDLYNDLISEISRQIPSDQKLYRIFFSFRGYEADKRLAWKTIFFLLTDYEINLNHNVIIVHPPSPEIILLVKNEVVDLNIAVKNYTIHPLPLIYYDSAGDSIKLEWLGIYEKEDIEKLNQILFDQFSLARSDFKDSANIIGHINYFDEYGNLKTNLPGRDELVDYYRNGYLKVDENEIIKILKQHECYSNSEENKLFLCHGNYFQKEFIEIIHLLNDKQDCDFVSEMLFQRLFEKIDKRTNFRFLGITSSSHKILRSLIEQKFIEEDQVLFLDNYFSFDLDSDFGKMVIGENYILVCDIISTGMLAKRLFRKLAKKGIELSFIAVIVNTIDESFEDSSSFITEFGEKLIALHNYPIKKYRKKDQIVSEYLETNNPIRVNPFTNVSINLSFQETNPNSIILGLDQFLESIDEEHILLGYLLANNMLHPYYFDTKKIIEKLSLQILTRIFDGINPERLHVFYPKDSGIKSINFDKLNSDIFKNDHVQYFELDRFITTEGWKFPHATDYFLKLNDGKRVLILDDGSCTGDSLLQMIGELAFSRVKEITVLCFIGRITDHKREFFSRVSKIQTKDHEQVKVEIKFVSHWHIPTYYTHENPNTIERSWLKEIISLRNTPESIRSIASLILKMITPSGEKEFVPYKFLPHERATMKVPKKAILKIREEVGKVIGYRFYKENFEYFDQLNSEYGEEGLLRKFEQLELLCATFAYEPYLYAKICFALPDITGIIEDFIDKLIFKRSISPEDDLFYLWDKKDIVHLFFVVYKGKRLTEKLKDTNMLKQLISFSGALESTINYVLFKFLEYFPLTKNDLPEKNAGDFLHLTDLLLQTGSLNLDQSQSVKIFRSFVATLPSNADYYSQLAVISEYYRKMRDMKEHKESVLADYDKVMVELEVMQVNYTAVHMNDFLESWRKISAFIETILSFASSFPNFFLSRLHLLEGDSDISLRSLHGQLNGLINNINADAEIDRIKVLFANFNDKFLDNDSNMSKIFREISIPNAVKKITEIFESATPITDQLKLESSVQEEIMLDFPFYFLCEEMLKEIIINLRHSDKQKPIFIDFKLQGDYLTITICNFINPFPTQGGGQGIANLKKINSFPEKIVSYKHSRKTETEQFIQVLQIKTT
jgi:orotate phosphoribosyltransferase